MKFKKHYLINKILTFHRLWEPFTTAIHVSESITKYKENIVIFIFS